MYVCLPKCAKRADRKDRFALDQLCLHHVCIVFGRKAFLVMLRSRIPLTIVQANLLCLFDALLFFWGLFLLLEAELDQRVRVAQMWQAISWPFLRFFGRNGNLLIFIFIIIFRCCNRQCGDVWKLWHLIEHEAKIVFQGLNISFGLISFLFKCLLLFLLLSSFHS